MSRKGYYSPVLRRDLVTRMYYAAKEFGIPMTVLNDRLVEAALSQLQPPTAQYRSIGYSERVAKAA